MVALATFAGASLLDQRSAQARLIKDRLATVQKAPEREPNEEFALLRDEQLSKIPAFDTLLLYVPCAFSAIQDAMTPRADAGSIAPETFSSCARLQGFSPLSRPWFGAGIPPLPGWR